MAAISQHEGSVQLTARSGNIVIANSNSNKKLQETIAPIFEKY